MIAVVESLAYTRTGKRLLTVSGGEELEALYDSWKGKSVEMKPVKPRRSLDANAYAWVLIDKLAEKLNISKQEVYREAIRDIGGVSDTVCVQTKAVSSLVNGWGHNGLGWFCETFPSKIPGCVNVILYRGSSEYSSSEMAALIDHIIQDCKAVGIETLPPEKIAAMNAAWENKKRRNDL